MLNRSSVSVSIYDQFMMANGTLVRTLIHTDVTKYLSFKAVDGSYVFSKGKVFLWLTLISPILYG
jgi:Rab GDP dissociation inhibitor